MNRAKTSATINEPMKLATVPSQVLFGLKCGASLYLPKDRPTKYAAESPTQVITSTKRSKRGPSGPVPWSLTANDNGNATKIRPLALIPAAGSASTSGRFVASVSTAIPSTKRKNTASWEGSPLPKYQILCWTTNPPEILYVGISPMSHCT